MGCQGAAILSAERGVHSSLLTSAVRRAGSLACFCANVSLSFGESGKVVFVVGVFALCPVLYIMLAG